MSSHKNSNHDIQQAIFLEAVSKRFAAGGRQVQALDRVSATVKGGVVTGLIGPDAAGKTTLMHELRRLAVACVDEVAREIIQTQMKIGVRALPWFGAALFALGGIDLDQLVRRADILEHRMRCHVGAARRPVEFVHVVPQFRD